MKRIVLLALVAIMYTSQILATTLLSLTLRELVGGSSFIFIGTVTDVVARHDADLVYTFVSFAIEDVVSGEPAGESLTLRFLGGERDGERTDVAGQFIPAVGAYGLWFVEALDEAQVNPLTGWSQGYFPLSEDANGELWLDLRGHPDYGLIVEPADPLAAKMRGLRFSREQIAEHFPEEWQFPLADFVEVIRAVSAEIRE